MAEYEEETRVSSSRPRKGNVIYANFGKTKPVAEDDRTPRDIEVLNLSHAAQRVMRAVFSRTDQGRVQRGKQYYRDGNVIDLKIRNGAAHMQVAGSQNQPFAVSFVLPYRAPEDIAEIARIVAETPNGADLAKIGDFDDRILDIVFGSSPKDIRFGCDCPDPQVVCKHVVASAYRLATRIDADASLVFQLRGLTMQVVANQALRHAETLARESTKAGSEYFWSGRPLPELPEPKVAPTLADSDLSLLQKAMQTISYSNLEQLRAVSDIEDMFDHLTR